MPYINNIKAFVVKCQFFTQRERMKKTLSFLGERPAKKKT
jgi:hypothetical protein